MDLSNTSLEDLVNIHNQVLRQIATQAKVNLGAASEPHDSHSSNHSNNKIVEDAGIAALPEETQA